MPPRSYCPINLGLEIFGDAWTLLVLRDLMFGGKRHFRELLHSDEGISSNILADRLKRLIDREILTKHDDPTHKQKAIYSLTERGIALLPVLLQVGAWSRAHLPEIRRSDPRALEINRSLAENPAAMRRKMAELRKAHLGR
jgi:DNA-binding HxlR family transcriptional regulator